MKRRLTTGEIQLARLMFQDAIDYASVRLVFGAWWQTFSRAAIAPNGQIYFPKSAYCADFSQSPAHLQIWFMHEMTHVWQYQRGFSVLLSGVCLFCQAGYVHARAYRYWQEGQDLPAFARLNMEQQAEVIAHYFAAAYLQVDALQKRLPQLSKCVQPFLRHPYHLSLLPQHSRCGVVHKAQYLD